MTEQLIVHLVDDVTPGGVMRVLDHILTAPDLRRGARHILRRVDRVRVVSRRIEADMIVSHLSVNWRGLPHLIALRAMHPDVPLLHVEHSYTQAFTALNVPHKGRFHTLLRVAYALFDRVVAVSRAQGDWLAQRGLVDPDALRVIPSCVALERFRALPAPASRRVIGAIGRLHRQKGFDTLIEAFRALPDPDLELHLHGDGPDRDLLRDLAGGDRRIRFRGHGGDPAAIMAEVDVVAMPSRWEAYGLVALEARAACRPLIVAPVDGLRDHIAAGATPVRGGGVAAWSTALRTATAAPSTPDARAPEAEAAFADAWQQLIGELVAPSRAAAA
ncbi:glycosyltransferase [Seohaeicola saemankumensis]|nr:glycosyltransferase [Seohaeicola saemankumensis]